MKSMTINRFHQIYDGDMEPGKEGYWVLYLDRLAERKALVESLKALYQEYGCLNTSCIVGQPHGMGTAGPCRCRPHSNMSPTDVQRSLRAIMAMSRWMRELVKEYEQDEEITVKPCDHCGSHHNSDTSIDLDEGKDELHLCEWCRRAESKE